MPLTKRQREILTYLQSYAEENGYAPSFDEIARQFNYNSLATVHEHLTNLERKGYIKRSYNESRAINILPSEVFQRAVELPLHGLVAAGVPETDVRTTSITLEQQTDRDGNITGHRVRNVVAVRSADVEGISALVGQAMAAGATRVVNISFGLADRSGPMDRARSLALENARGKAEQLAARAGVELGRPIAIGSS